MTRVTKVEATFWPNSVLKVEVEASKGCLIPLFLGK